MISRAWKSLGGTVAGLSYPVAALVAVMAPQPALASDWGCQVVLCLATPGSPTTYAACVPPITRLWNVLALGGSFPTCTGVGMVTRRVRHGYELTVTRSDGATSRYALDTRYRTVTQQ
jgi:hypothetical protein